MRFYGRLAVRGRTLGVVVTALLLVLAIPAGAASVDPKTLVLARSDLPAGYRLDRDESGLRTNERESKDGREARELVVRSGRITGYEATWGKREITLDSRADLCRRSSGARILFDFVVQEMRKSGIKGLRRAPAGVGADSWIYSGGDAQVSGFALVVWRYDRVFAGIVGVGLSRTLGLELARKQQRRIARALG
jgi:hypothetical protein